MNAAPMRADLNALHGLIMSEAVMMGLAPHLERKVVHHAVKHTRDIALAEGIPLTQALAHDSTIASQFDSRAISRLTQPANYLGATQDYIDRVTAAARASG